MWRAGGCRRISRVGRTCRKLLSRECSEHRLRLARTIATQCAEVSADFATFEFDQRCAEFLRANGAGEYAPAVPDSDAAYADLRVIDLAAMEPYVARPGKVSSNALPVSQVEARPVNQCFVGSCANGQLEDLRIAAEIMGGRQVAP